MHVVTAYKRFICSVDKIMELIGLKCHTMDCDRDCRFTPGFVGCCLTITGLCSAGHVFTWNSSHVHLNKAGSKIFEDNFNVAISTVTSGNNFSKVNMLFDFLKMPVLSLTTFHAYQRSYILPGISRFFHAKQVRYTLYTMLIFMPYILKDKIIEEYRGKTVALAGDGRCDSPGSSAKYCTYSLLDIDTDTIVHMEILDKREVALQSPNMEKESVVRAINHLHDNHIVIKELVTDASSSVRKMLGKLNRIIDLKLWYVVYSYRPPQYTPFNGHLAQSQKIEEGTY